MLRVASLLLIANLCAPLTPAQTTLAESPPYQAGLRRMEGHLPDLALPNFAKALKDFENDAEAQATIKLKMGEASVRAAREESDHSAMRIHAQAALEHLSLPRLKDVESSIFWSAQASLLLVEFKQAADLFRRLAEAKDPNLRTRALLSRAHLLATMGQPEEATALLLRVAAVKDPHLAGEARLLHATLLLMQGRFDELEALIPDGVTSNNPTHRGYERYIRARMAQAKGDPQTAGKEFRALSEQPEHLGAMIHHGARVGLAECLRAAGELEEATETLISLIDKHPRTPLLEASFLRLLNWSTTETLKGRFEQQLALWANALGNSIPEATPKDPGGPQVVISTASDRSGFALYYYSVHLAEKNDTKSNALAENLLARLTENLPAHSLVPAALLATAALQIGDRRKVEALATLSLLEKSTGSFAIKAEAADLMARLKFKAGDFKGAAAAFQRVRTLLEPAEAKDVAFNTGICLLHAGERPAFGSYLKTLNFAETRNTLLLEQGLHLASVGSGDARAILERFLRENQHHSRLPEARLAYAKEWLRLEPSSKAAQQQVKGELETLDQLTLPAPLALSHLLLHLQLAGLIQDWKPAIAAANRFMKNHKQAEVAPIIRLRLAEAYFSNNDLSVAQREFQSVASAADDPVVKEVALFYAAQAALKLRTAKSPQEAMDLLQQVIKGKGPLANDARLSLARSLIDTSPTDALIVLQPLLSNQIQDRKIDAFVLAAAAHKRIGAEENLKEALKIYDHILSKPKLSYPLSNRLHSLKGQAYERLGEPGLALETYYTVIDFENLNEGEKESEWYYFYECAFKAIQILETGRPRWQATLDILRKVEDSGSPWSADARKQREHLKLKHQLFDAE
ncbi:MAG: tetratricopeptide repeat protein [Roseibacillus sp.]|nr:tetratricopeptide repeat protein [Roseibacillus sp.]